MADKGYATKEVWMGCQRWQEVESMVIYLVYRYGVI